MKRTRGYVWLALITVAFFVSCNDVKDTGSELDTTEGILPDIDHYDYEKLDPVFWGDPRELLTGRRWAQFIQAKKKLIKGDNGSIEREEALTWKNKRIIRFEADTLYWLNEKKEDVGNKYSLDPLERDEISSFRKYHPELDLYDDQWRNYRHYKLTVDAQFNQTITGIILLEKDQGRDYYWYWITLKDGSVEAGETHGRRMD